MSCFKKLKNVLAVIKWFIKLLVRLVKLNRDKS